MSWIYFSRKARSITLIKGSGGPGVFEPDLKAFEAAGTWPAHNDVASSSRGIWPVGRYEYSHYNAHAEAGLAWGCHVHAYGCFGIHVFKVSGRSGMGIHAGRTQGQPNVTGGKTLGCIRVPPNAMSFINSVHKTDPIRYIYVAE